MWSEWKTKEKARPLVRWPWEYGNSPEATHEFHVGRTYVSGVNYNDLTVLPNPGIMVKILGGIIPIHGRSIQVSEILWPLPRCLQIFNSNQLGVPGRMRRGCQVCHLQLKSQRSQNGTAGIYHPQWIGWMENLQKKHGLDHFLYGFFR